MSYRNELARAIDAVRSASLLCRAVQARIRTESLEKEDRSPVTVADFGSQAVICRILEDAFPDDPVVAEEDSDALRDPGNHRVLNEVRAEVGKIVPGATTDGVCAWIDRGNAVGYSDRFWTLDPIDGTKGFLRGDQYAVALALIVDGRVVVAALGCPNLDGSGGIFAAVSGEGAFTVPIDGNGTRRRIRVSDVRTPSAARFCESYVSAHSSHDDAAAAAQVLGISKAPLRIDSQAKYAVVARGDAEIYLRLTRHTGYVENIWDHAAGTLVIEEAGGCVTDLNGKRLDFSRGVRLDDNIGIVATNGVLHERVLAALENVFVSE